ncbi:MAG: tRNA-modifying protein YgfZ [Comamonadaceae bacterium]|nr:tRNA-modifying protein YgfZ [Comamonadaceae bacterium]
MTAVPRRRSTEPALQHRSIRRTARPSASTSSVSRSPSGPRLRARLWQRLATIGPAGRHRGLALARHQRRASRSITTRTQEEFVPQMANFELIGGVSFQKGCYPGQEIVARTQYLGKLKRRMYLAHLAQDTAPEAGTHLYSADMADQSCGMVVNSAARPRRRPRPSGGDPDVERRRQATCIWAASNGPRLEFRALPYALG